MTVHIANARVALLCDYSIHELYDERVFIRIFQAAKDPVPFDIARPLILAEDYRDDTVQFELAVWPD